MMSFVIGRSSSVDQRPTTNDQRLQYSTGMSSAHDVLTRWPQLDVTGKRARLQESLRLTPGPLADVITASVAAAERAAGALWLREPSAWSDTAAVQKKIAARLGWM